MDTPESDLNQAIVEVGQIGYQRGLLSVRLPDGNLLITPSLPPTDWVKESMKPLPSLLISQHIARHPIIQGAMAVCVSGASLAGAVAELMASLTEPISIGRGQSLGFDIIPSRA